MSKAALTEEENKFDFSHEITTEEEAERFARFAFLSKKGSCGFANAGDAIYITNNYGYSIIATIRVTHNITNKFNKKVLVGSGASKYVGCTFGGSLSDKYEYNLIKVEKV